MTAFRTGRFALALASLLFAAVPAAIAQVPDRVYGQSNGLCDPDNVDNCLKPNPDGSLPVAGTFSASLGGFAPDGNYASLAVSTSSGNVALPNGSTVVIYNAGAVDAYVALGSNGVAATTGNDVVKAGQSIALTPGSNTYLAAVTAAGSTSLTLSGGSGLYTGVGGGGGGGSGGSVSATLGAFVDGSIVGIGAEADSAWSSGSGTLIGISKAIAQFPRDRDERRRRAGSTACGSDTGSCNLNALLQRIAQRLTTLNTALGSPYQAGASLPLPSGAATSAKQPALGTPGTPSGDVLTVQGTSGMTPLKVDGSSATPPVSAASLPLPSGAATSAKQPALGTAGTPSADVLTVQGASGMSALKVDGSAVTPTRVGRPLDLGRLDATFSSRAFPTRRRPSRRAAASSL